METVKQIDYRAMIQLKVCYQERRLTRQQYRTLRGQVIAGEGEAALRGLRTILDRSVKQ